MMWWKRPHVEVNVYAGDPDHRSPDLMDRTFSAVTELTGTTEVLRQLIQDLIDHAQDEAQQQEEHS